MRIEDWARAAAMGGAGVLALAGSAAAQTNVGTQAATQFSIVDTPAAQDLPNHLSLNATAEAEYQSNVSGGDAAVAALRGLKQDDWVFTPTALFEGFRHFGAESLYVTGSTGYSFYDHNSVLNREVLDVDGGANARFGLCRSTLSGGYVRHQQELQDVTRTSVQDVYDQTTLQLEGACGRSTGFSPNFTVTQTWSTNSLAALQSSNYSTIGGNGGVSYQTPTLGIVTAYGQYSATDFNNRLLNVGFGAVHDGYDSYGGGVRFVRQLGARIQGVVSVSYTAIRPYVGSSGFDGPTYMADITYRLSSRLTLHGNVTRDVQPSNVFDSEYYLETKGLVEGTYSLGSRLQVLLGASEVDRTFKGPAIAKNLDLQNDSVKAIYTTVTYTLRKVFIALDGRYQYRSAGLPGLSAPDFRSGLTVGTRF